MDFIQIFCLCLIWFLKRASLPTLYYWENLFKKPLPLYKKLMGFLQWISAMFTSDTCSTKKVREILFLMNLTQNKAILFCFNLWDLSESVISRCDLLNCDNKLILKIVEKLTIYGLLHIPKDIVAMATIFQQIIIFSTWYYSCL